MLRKRVSSRRDLRLQPLEDRLCLSSLPQGTALARPDAATRAHLSAAYGQLPLSFEANKGQTDPRVNFLTRGAGYSAVLTPTGAVMELQQGDGGNIVAMKLVGASPTPHLIGLDKQYQPRCDHPQPHPGKRCVLPTRPTGYRLAAELMSLMPERQREDETVRRP